MKNRTTIRAVAILTAFAAAALLSVTPGGTRAQEAAFWNPLAGLSEYLQERCESAWYESSASQTCRFRSGGVDFERTNWNRCVLSDLECALRHTNVSNMWFLNDYWNGPIEELRGLSNCHGVLRYGTCR